MTDYENLIDITSDSQLVQKFKEVFLFFILVRIMPRIFSFIKTCISSADTLCQHILVQNWILKLHSNKNKIQKQTQCGVQFENSTFQYQAKHKKNLLRKKERKKTTPCNGNCKYEAY
jgi:hypothetical protein